MRQKEAQMSKQGETRSGERPPSLAGIFKMWPCQYQNCLHYGAILHWWQPQPPNLNRYPPRGWVQLELASYYHRVHYVYPSSCIGTLRVPPNFFRHYTSRKTRSKYVIYSSWSNYMNIFGRSNNEGKIRGNLWHDLWQSKSMIIW